MERSHKKEGRRSIPVFTICGDDESIYRWKHTWRTKKNEIENLLDAKGVSISDDVNTGTPIATFASKHPENLSVLVTQAFKKAAKDITASKHRLKSDILKTELDKIRYDLSDKEVSIYADRHDDGVWIVGEISKILDAIKYIDCKVDEITEEYKQDKKDDDDDDVGSFEQITDPQYVNLSEKEQAIMWLYGLLNKDFLKAEGIEIVKEHFNFKISVLDAETKHNVEKEIHKINFSDYKIVSRKQRFSSGLFQFAIKNEVHDFLNSELNYLSGGPKIVWLCGGQNEFTLYTKTEREITEIHRKFLDLLKEDSASVPKRYFCCDEAKQSLEKLEKQYNGKAVVKLSAQCSTVHFYYTSDIYDIKTKITCMYTVRFVVIVRSVDECKRLFKTIQPAFQQKYNINLCAQEQNLSYSWEIKGGENMTRKAYDELQKLTDSAKSEIRIYQTDKALNQVQQIVKEIHQEGFYDVIVTDQVSTSKGIKNIDLREAVSCKIWNLDDGSILSLYNCSIHEHEWLIKDCMVVQIQCAEHLGADMNIRNVDKSTMAILYLPFWDGGAKKEKEKMRDRLQNLMEVVSKSKGKSFMSVAFDLSDGDIVKWPRKKYVKQLLATIHESKPSIQVHFHESRNEDFRKEVDIIDNWTSTLSSSGSNRSALQISIVKGELVQQQCQAIVNSTSENLDLDFGKVSNTILQHAGPEIQKECKEQLKGRLVIDYAEVVVTKGYNLPCKNVLHGTLPMWNTNSTKQIFQTFVQNCLQHASHLSLKSIAFPALGTGRLGYSKNYVAEKMFFTVEKFAKENPSSSLKDVRFVIYQKDFQTLQAFQKEEAKRTQNRMKRNVGIDSAVACPYAVPYSVSVVGENEKCVQNIFREIEGNLKRKETPFKKVDKPSNAMNDLSPKETLLAVQEPNDQTIYRGEENRETRNEHPETAHNFQQERKEEDNTFLPQDIVDSVSVPEPAVECYVAVKILRFDRSGKIPDELQNIVSRYGIQDEQIIWNPYNPQQARIKFKNDSESEQLINSTRLEKGFQLEKCAPQAVVNIRARLNSSMKELLHENDSLILLTQQSGVEVHTSANGTIILTGNLSDISEARSILLHWKDEMKAKLTIHANASNKLPQNHDSGTQTPAKHDSAEHINDQPVVSDTSDKWNSKVQEKENGELAVRFNVDNSKLNAAMSTSLDEMKENEKEGTCSTYYSQKSYPTHNGDQRTGDNENKFPALYPKLPSHINSNDAGPDHQPDETFEEHYSKYAAGVKQAEQIEDFPVRTDDSLMVTTKEGIKVYVYRGNICYLRVRGIVNSSNSGMYHSRGLSKVIVEAAGESVQKECEHYVRNHALDTGNVFVSKAGNLDHYGCILHVNAPKWKNFSNEDVFADLLSETVFTCLAQASKQNLPTVALPALSSGAEGVPKALCFKSYPEGVQRYSSKFGKKSSLKEVHFVDISQDIVDHIQAAFIYTIPESDSQRKGKLQRIPVNVQEVFVKNIRSILQAGKHLELYNLPNKVTLLICDGALMNSTKHQHTLEKPLKKISFEQSAVIVPENKDITGKCGQLCVSRGGKDFATNYEELKKRKKQPGDVLEIQGDGKLGFRHVFCCVMPSFSEAAKIYNSESQIFLRKIISKCCRNVLNAADQKKVTQVSMPVLGADFYDYAEKWYLEWCVSSILNEVRVFAAIRKPTSKSIVIHVVTNGNDQLFKFFESELSRTTVSETAL